MGFLRMIGVGHDRGNIDRFSKARDASQNQRRFDGWILPSMMIVGRTNREQRFNKNGDFLDSRCFCSVYLPRCSRERLFERKISDNLLPNITVLTAAISLLL